MPRVHPIPPAAALREGYEGRRRSLDDLAAVYGVAPGTVRRWLDVRGIAVRPGKGTPAGRTCGRCGAPLSGGAQRWCRACRPAAYAESARARMERVHRRAGCRPRRRPPVAPGPGEKWCPRCEATQAETAFRRIGGARRHSWCRPCEVAWQQDRARARKQARKEA